MWSEYNRGLFANLRRVANNNPVGGTCWSRAAPFSIFIWQLAPGTCHFGGGITNTWIFCRAKATRDLRLPRLITFLLRTALRLVFHVSRNCDCRVRDVQGLCESKRRFDGRTVEGVFFLRPELFWETLVANRKIVWDSWIDTRLSERYNCSD